MQEKDLQNSLDWLRIKVEAAANALKWGVLYKAINLLKERTCEEFSYSFVHHNGYYVIRVSEYLGTSRPYIHFVGYSEEQGSKEMFNADVFPGYKFKGNFTARSKDGLNWVECCQLENEPSRWRTDTHLGNWTSWKDNMYSFEGEELENFRVAGLKLEEELLEN